ncbi:uncharacterized protein LOC126372355 [Pectinophora gossypiella]|uniref:uncharacterized protein LOC126372355 n=1 Tax=Pectinophora gossypiella TaxID=13191 RepID=UPI00214EA93A|nr:uncharacterized protein LOC126372355 [Pectinophora gossypiella]
MMKLVVLSCLMSAACASALLPLAYTYSAPLLAPYNYRGPLSLAPGQPANILAADGRPLDTLDVNLDRSAHYTAKALDGGLHLLKKRSLAVAPLPGLAYTAPLAYRAPIAYSAPLAYSAPIYAKPILPIAHALY